MINRHARIAHANGWTVDFLPDAALAKKMRLAGLQNREFFTLG